MTFVPPPYDEIAPDGRRYFKILGVSPHLIRMYDLLLRAAELAAARPGRSGQAQAARIDLLILDVKRKVDQAARTTAIEADKIIKSKIDSTRVRPPTLGLKNDHTSLLSGIHSRPVPSILPGGGAVGIADIAVIEKATTRPSANSNVPFYWRAQEFGSEHLVGRTLYGVYLPGDAKPDATQFGVHPLFEYRRKGNTPRFSMVVRNPIRERAFLREGAWDAYVFRKRLHEATEGVAIEEMRRIEAGAIRP